MLIQSHMDVVFFVYGLAFIALALVIIAQPKEENPHELAKQFGLLAAFGLIHGLLEWVDFWIVVRGGNPSLEIGKVALLFLSFGFLFEFGRRLIQSLCAKDSAIPALACQMLGKPVYGVVALGFLIEFTIIPDWMLAAQIASRYFLGFGGALMAGTGFILCARQNRLQQTGAAHPWTRTYFILAAIAFFLYGIAGGVVVPPADVFPSNIINYPWFISTFQFPVQLLRAACAVSVAIAVGNILRIFHLESLGKLQSALATVESLLTLAKEQTQELKESEARLYEITCTLGEGVYVLDENQKITFTNPEAWKLLGWVESELFGKNAHALFHHKKADGILIPEKDCEIARVVQSGKTYRSDGEVFWRKDGSALPVSVISSPIIREGKIAGSVVTFRDVTEYKRAERLLEFENHALAVISSNPPLTDILKILCRGIEETLEKSLCSILLVDEGRTHFHLGAAPSLPEEFNRALEGLPISSKTSPCATAVLSGKSVIVPDLIKDTQWECGKGLALPYGLQSVWSAPIYSATGDVLGTFAIYYRSPHTPTPFDMELISRIAHLASIAIQHNRAGEDLKRLNETLEHRVVKEVSRNMEQERLLIQQARLAAMGEMIGNIAHQWRQPLNALGLLLANIKDDHDYQELDAETMARHVTKGRLFIDKMSSTIDDFRNFFKPNKVKCDFSLRKAIDDTINLIGPGLRSYNILMNIEEGEDILLNGFPNEFSQVLLNILTNAKDALLERKIANGKLEIGFGRSGARKWIRVRDNAGGIAEEVLPKIFDPYFTTKESGTGIGLYMSKMILEHMGGRIEARNIGEGTEFLITFLGDA
ncbi:MAG: GAF domain-containing protein [Betaproteobacteria bacterium]|nr:GAF domain-containing protein [Betaproteobacteria bacterium]